MLNRFWFGFSQGDHHIRHIQADAEETEPKRLEVTFRDTNFDDEMKYGVSHAWVTPTSGIVRGQATTPASGCVHVCALNLSVPRPPRGHEALVLRGFSLQWLHQTDHHIDTVEVTQNGGGIVAAFSDDGDAPFRAVVDYYWVSLSYFSKIDQVSDSVFGLGSDSKPVPVGPKVIRGFSFQAVDDNHLSEFGVQADSQNINVFFSDKDPSNSGRWDYQVLYATLK